MFLRTLSSHEEDLEELLEGEPVVAIRVEELDEEKASDSETWNTELSLRKLMIS